MTSRLPENPPIGVITFYNSRHSQPNDVYHLSVVRILNLFGVIDGNLNELDSNDDPKMNQIGQLNVFSRLNGFVVIDSNFRETSEKVRCDRNPMKSKLH
jgi:hypothetical protein